MLTFRDTTDESIGRADCLKLITIENNIISDVIGRPVQVYFLVRITIRSGHEYFLDKVPTGIFDVPYTMTPHEYLITDGEDYWEAARHRTPEELVEAGTRDDPGLYILDQAQLPPRLQRLSVLDKQHVLDKIRVFCDSMTNNPDNSSE